jgi:acyl carrier protein
MKIEERVIEVILANSEEIEEITVDSHLEEDLGIDSFGTLMIVNGLEDEFEIVIEERHVKEIRTVREIVEVLRRSYGIEG